MDALLLLVVLLWGVNYTVLKAVFRELPPLAFNVVRLSCASAVFLALIAASTFVRRVGGPQMTAAIAEMTPGGTTPLALFRTASRITGRDWVVLAVLGVIGHFLYQAFFVEGLARTNVANASLIIGVTPIAVSIGSALVGRDRLAPSHWAGIAVSAIGMYLVVGTRSACLGRSLAGDAMMLACVLCWTVYTLAGQELLRRHSPLVVTGWSMAFGTLVYVPYSLEQARGVPTGRSCRRSSGSAIVLSALLALNFSYVIWYAAVQRLGSARTSVYSNLVPVTALITAAIWLAEPVPAAKLLGAALDHHRLARVAHSNRCRFSAGRGMRAASVHRREELDFEDEPGVGRDVAVGSRAVGERGRDDQPVGCRRPSCPSRPARTRR